MDRFVGSIDCGRKRVPTKKHTFHVNFIDFVDLKNGWGREVISPPILCHGISWLVRLFPFGEFSSDRGWISIFLRPQLECRNSEVKATFSLRLKDRVAKTTKTFSQETQSWGFPNFLERSKVLDSENGYLVDGTLTVAVDIQVYTDSPSPWKANNNLSRHMLQMMDSTRFSDVTFQIGKKEFPAHCCVLECRAPALLELAEGSLTSNSKHVQLGNNVDHDAFKAFLHFVYANELPSNIDLSTDAKKFLDMSDKFGCTELKLVAESELVKLGITRETAAELLLYADAKNCALLREAAMNYVCANSGAVMQTEGWRHLRESPLLMAEIMEASNKKRDLSDAIGDDNDTDFDNMSVATLRKKLCNRGLDVDGSRKMLVDRLLTSMAP